MLSATCNDFTDLITCKCKCKWNSLCLKGIIYQADRQTHRTTEANFTCPMGHQTSILTCPRAKFTCPRQSEVKVSWWGYTSHACHFPNMWKWKSAGPENSRKAGYAPDCCTYYVLTFTRAISILPIGTICWYCDSLCKRLTFYFLEKIMLLVIRGVWRLWSMMSI